MLSLSSFAASFNGWKASPTAPSNPSSSSPLPNIAVLNSSVVLAIPKAEPRIAPPAIPKGPPTVISPAAAPIPAPLRPAGRSLFKISFC